MGTRTAYPVEVKLKAIEMKKQGFSNTAIMRELNIKNKTQVKTWWKWYRNGEHHRFRQPVGKQYTYGKGPENISDTEKLQHKVKFLEQQIEVLKKYKELERKCCQKY